MEQLTLQSSPADLVTYLKTRTFLETLDEAILQKLAAHVEWVTLPPEGLLFRQGDPSDALYIVVRGGLRVIITQEDGGEGVVGTIEPDQPVGEMQILSGGYRTASVHAMRETELIKIPKESFDRLADESPNILEEMAAITYRRLRQSQLRSILPHFFGQLDEQTLCDIEAEVEWVQLPRGSVLFHLGDPGDSFYIVVSGRLHAVVRDQSGNERVVGEIQRGESVGEMAMFTGETRTASIYAVRDSELVRLSKSAFDRIVVQHPNVVMQITQLIIRRLRRTISVSTVTEAVTSIAIVPISSDVSLTEFTQRLVNVLKTFDATLHVNAEQLDRFLGTPGIAQTSSDSPHSIRVAAWLDAQETNYRFILYETDRWPSPWTQRCLRQVDQILLVGQASAPPGLSEIEKSLLHSENRMVSVPHILVLLHPDGSRPPSGTRQWLDVRQVERHYHVRWDTRADIERIARFLAGRAVGLALSGGGARGFAHIGAIRAVEEAGIPIDIIGGTSMGSYISGEYALGWDSEGMMQANRSIFNNTLYDVTLPISSMCAGRRWVRRLKRCFGDVRIEDLWVPYFCVSSNITRAELMVHRTGPLWIGMRASGGLPGLLPPVVLNEDLLVDGALLSNLPADVMRKLCGGGTVIAVDVSPPVEMTENVPYGDSLSGWRILWSKINPFMKAITMPDIATVLQRAGEISSIARQRSVIQEAADLYIRMPVEHFALLDFKSADKIIDVGYRYAAQRITEWQSGVKSK